MRVLIVEDDPANRMYLKEILRPYGQVSEAANGQQAVEAFDRSMSEGQVFDLILMDIMMPEMDGHRALELIRQREKDFGRLGEDMVKVLMISSLDDPKNVNRAFFQGEVLDFISKPVDRQELLAGLARFGLIEI